MHETSLETVDDAPVAISSRAIVLLAPCLISIVFNIIRAVFLNSRKLLILAAR